MGLQVRPGAAPDSEPVMKELKHTMNAIIVTGGKQYKVAEGDVVYIEKLDQEAGDTVKFDQVLAILDGDKATFGTPVWRALPWRPRSSRTARARRSASSSTTPRRVTASVRAIVSLTPRLRSPRSLSEHDHYHVPHGG